MKFSKNFKWILWLKETKLTKTTPSQLSTLQLFKKYKNLEKIAEQRNFKLETIEIQIIELIVKSLIHINDILDKNKKQQLKDFLKQNKSIENLRAIKQNNQNLTYFEIKSYLAHILSKPNKIKTKTK